MENDDKLEALGKSLGLDFTSEKFKFEADAGKAYTQREILEKFLEEFNSIDGSTYENSSLQLDLSLDSMQTKMHQYAKLFYHFAKKMEMISMTKQEFYINCFTVGLLGYASAAHYFKHSIEAQLIHMKDVRENPDKYRKELETLINGEIPE